MSEYRADRWFWPLSLLMSVFYIVIDFSSGIYANGAICCYNFAMSVYGLLMWRGVVQSKDKTERPITSCPARYAPWLVAGTAVLTAVLWWLLQKLGESQYPLLDGCRRHSRLWPCGCWRKNIGNNGYAGSLSSR